MLASALCGLAPSAGVLVGDQIAHGIGGAFISPTVLAIIGVAYPGQARVRAITVYGLVMGLAAAGGQLLGGLPIALDLPGMALVTLALTALVLPLVAGTQLHWPAWTQASLAAVPVLLGLLAATELRTAGGGGAPLLDPALFRSRALASGLATQLAFWCGRASFFQVLALYLQAGLGLTALQAGLIFSGAGCLLSRCLAAGASPDAASRPV